MDQLGDGFDLGHQIATGHGVAALRLNIKFQERTPLQVVLDPANPVAQRVLGATAEADAYLVSSWVSVA